ncbi:hypothetical protein DFH94DRAFT_690764 [Russula ochroleuca]|uniref:cAMP-independent regulatory protein pac2 n=1 Tax=Russula ochroleuca TaxID=152965 RepID=A0A9P5MZD4_9AGAM|nr:hypothetical protein DFH94DRAFT_690764 [Russula ochroleuca]
MQVPSCTNVRIRSTADVHKIFYAVYLGLLPMITRRLDAKEREALSSGYCYAWEDRGPHAITGIGIERFTEGRHWSASRVRDEFLFYYEKWEPPKSKNGERTSDGQPPRDWDPYVKQTYSVYLNETAYFTQATVDSLGTVDDIPVLKDLAVPEGLFKSSRRTKSRSSRASAAAHAVDAAAPTSSPASSSSKSGKQIASVAGPSSNANRPPPQVAAQSAAPQQNQGLPPSAYPQDFFNAKSPTYPGLPTNSVPPSPAQQPDAYARIYTGNAYTPPQPPEGYHVPPSPHVQTHVAPFGYNWASPPTPVTDNACQPGYPYPVLVDSQKGDPAFHHSPVQSPQLYLYGSGFQASLHYRTVSPALSHAPSQFSASSQSQSSSESDSPAPGPVPLRTPVFSPDRLSVVLPTDGETKYEIHGLRDPDSTIDSKVGLVSMESLNRYHPYRREPLDDRVVQRFLQGPF